MKVLVTGGSGGMGSAVARACAERGGWPVITYCHHPAAAQAIVAACGVGETLWLDLRRPDLGTAGRLPAVDAVVHCAGSNNFQRSLLDSTEEELLEMLAVNAHGPLRVTRALLRHPTSLQHAIFVLSTAIACRGAGAYAVAKTAGLAICKLLARELSGRTRVDAIVPGWIETALGHASARAMGRDLELLRQEHLDGRLLGPDELATLCAGLLWDTAPGSPGQVVLWDRRLSREPIYLAFDNVLAFDRIDPAWRVAEQGLGLRTE